MIQRFPNLLNILGHNRSTFLFGTRGTGKSKLIEELFRAGLPGTTINLLHSEVFRRYKLNPSQFRKDIDQRLQNDSCQTIAIDEIQKIPELLDEVHALIEAHKKKVRFVLTGSSARKLKRGGANLLAGRALTTRLHPLNALELKLDLSRALTVGTLPGIYLDTEDVAPVLNAYVDTYIREELLQEAIIRKVDPFLRFLDVAAQCNAEPITFSRIAKEAAVSPHTVESYFQILEDTMIGRMIPAFHRSVRKQLTKSPKFFFFDCGVLNQLRGELSTELKESSYRYGKLFETFMVNQFLAANDYLGTQLTPYHWRTSNGLEVDLILAGSASAPPIAIEFKSSTAPSEQDVKGLFKFREEHPNACLYIVSRTPHEYLVEGISVLPWEASIRKILK